MKKSSESVLNLVYSSPDDVNSFFGYYGFNPYKSGRLLQHRTYSQKDVISNDDIVHIGYVSLSTGVFTSLAETSTANWQHGCMPRWVSDNKVGFNTYINGDFIFRIQDLEIGIYTDFPGFVYEVSPNFVVAIPPGRISSVRRSYGFPQFDCGEIEYEDDLDYGVFIYSLTSGELVYRVPISRLKEEFPSLSSDSLWIDHPLISTDEKRIIFYLRESNDSGFYKTNFILYDFQSDKLIRLPDSGFYSHACWSHYSDILVFGRKASNSAKDAAKVKTVARKLLGGLYGSIVRSKYFRKFKGNVIPDRYILFPNDTLHPTVIADDLRIDGHPSFNPEFSNILITDTYADESNQQHLIVINIDSGEYQRLDSFDTRSDITPSSPDRCDLHPRWCGRSTVSIDTYIDGCRKSLVFSIDEEFLEEFSNV